MSATLDEVWPRHLQVAYLTQQRHIRRSFENWRSNLLFKLSRDFRDEPSKSGTFWQRGYASHHYGGYQQVRGRLVGNGGRLWMRGALLRRLGNVLPPAEDVLFGLIVFLADDFLAPRSPHPWFRTERRFLAISAALPMELQMRLCCLSQRHPSSNISSRRAEEAFLYLALLFEAKN